MLFIGFPSGSVVKNPPVKQELQETQVQSLGQEDSLEEGMAIYSSILVWRIPWTEEPGGLQSIGEQGVKHDWSDLACTHADHKYCCQNSDLGIWLFIELFILLYMQVFTIVHRFCARWLDFSAVTMSQSKGVRTSLCSSYSTGIMSDLWRMKSYNLLGIASNPQRVFPQTSCCHLSCGVSVFRQNQRLIGTCRSVFQQRSVLCIQTARFHFQVGKNRLDRARKHRQSRWFGISNNLGDWKEWGDADTLQTKVTVGRLAYVTVLSVRRGPLNLGQSFLPSHRISMWI